MYKFLIFFVALAGFFSEEIVWAHDLVVEIPTQTIMPCVTFNKFTRYDVRSSAVLIGAEHRYNKSEGFNSKIHLSGMNESDQKHLMFHVEGLYKFRMPSGTAIYPLVKASYAKYGFCTNYEVTEQYISKKMVHMGGGVEKEVSASVIMGAKGEIIQDVSHRTMYESAGDLRGYKEPKSTSFKVSGYAKIPVLTDGSVEIEPYYGKCFDGNYTEKGCKVGCGWSF